MTSDTEYESLNFGMGWVESIARDEARLIVSSDGIRTASQVTGKRAVTKDRVDLTTYLRTVWGDRWYLNQGSCGSCVAFGMSLACDILAAVQLIEAGSAEKPDRTDPMTIYWGSRVEIGGGRLWGQGSIGVWAAKYTQQYGALPQRKFPEVDLSRYDVGLCCGSLSRKGVPDTLEPIAKQYPVREYVQVRNFQEAIVLLESGYPITVASNQGFTQRLSSDGFASPSGRWAHQMCCTGYGLGSRPYIEIANSWGPYYVGGPAGQSPAVKKVDAAVFDRMASAGDTWGYSDFTFWLRPSLDYSHLNF